MKGKGRNKGIKIKERKSMTNGKRVMERNKKGLRVIQEKKKQRKMRKSDREWSRETKKIGNQIEQKDGEGLNRK